MQSGDTIAAAFLDTAVVTLTGTQTLTNKTITTPIIEKIHTLGGQVAIETLSNTNAVNYVQVKPQVTTGPPVVSAVGADTNIDLVIASKGSGVIKSKRGSATAVDVATVSDTQTFTGKTHTAPIIGATEWTNAGHAHAGATSGGTLDLGQCVTLNTKVPTTSLPVINHNDITLIASRFPVGTQGAILRGTATTVTPSLATRTYFWPFWAPRRTTVTLESVHYFVTQLSSLAGNFRMAVYANSSATAPAPVTVLADSGNIASNAGSIVAERIWTPALSLSGGRLYWLGIRFDANAVGGTPIQLTGHLDAQSYLDMGLALIPDPASSMTTNPGIGWINDSGVYGAYISPLVGSSTPGTWSSMLKWMTLVSYSA